MPTTTNFDESPRQLHSDNIHLQWAQHAHIHEIAEAHLAQHRHEDIWSCHRLYAANPSNAIEQVWFVLPTLSIAIHRTSSGSIVAIYFTSLQRTFISYHRRGMVAVWVFFSITWKNEGSIDKKAYRFKFVTKQGLWWKNEKYTSKDK